MPSVRSLNYDVILDKGTLDAIATGGSAPSELQLNKTNAAQFQVWRIQRFMI